MVEDSDAKRLDRILELEGKEAERGQDKRRFDELKGRAKALELAVEKLKAENKAKDERATQLAAEVDDERTQRKYFQEAAEAAQGEGGGGGGAGGRRGSPGGPGSGGGRWRQHSGSVDDEHSLGGGIGGSSSSSSSPGGGLGLGFGLGGGDYFVSPEVREKIRRLEKELEALKASGVDPKALETEREARLALEVEVASLRADAAAADAGSPGGAGGVGGVGGSRGSPGRGGQHSDEKVAALELQLKRLGEELAQRSDEHAKMAAAKEKLEAYTSKALHSVQDKYMLAIKTCKEQLKEKDEVIDDMTRQYKSFRQQSQREVQLLSSAVYELGMKISEKRLGESSER